MNSLRDMLAFMGYLKILLCLLWLYRHFASWAMSHRHRLLRQCRNTVMPSLAMLILCLLGYFASWVTLPLGLFCLLGFFASWVTLPLGLLCLLGLPLGLLCLSGYFASWVTLPLGLLCLSGYFASWATLPLGLLCLLGFISTLCLLGHVSLTLSALTMPVYWYASWAMPTLGTC
jgi:hypothetical protein